MDRYQTEPAYIHSSAEKTAVLLVNLGTPEAPTAAALRRYLAEFLWDPRVVEIPRLLWWLILKGVILNLRPRKSAAKYASIWTPQGSPLKVHTERQAKLLRGALDEGNLVVAWAMRYGQPSIAATLDRLKSEGCVRILVLPLYPQYAASATASVMDAVGAWLRRTRNLPELRFVRDFHDRPGYIAALAASVREHWATHGQPTSGYRLVMSFHGLPRYTLTRGDPYHCECHKTGRLLAEALNLAPEQWQLSFQSRFGRTEWLQPYTLPTLEQLASSGVSRVDVICPGFASDCLETLEEIAIEGKTAYLQAGGKEFHYIPCLNERDDWIAVLADLARAHLGHWLKLPAAGDPASATRAKAFGATQ